MYSITDIINTEIGELGNHVKVGFKKTVKVKEYETEVVSIETEVDLGEMTGPDRMMAYTLLEIQAEYTAMQGLVTKGAVTTAEFNTRVHDLEKYAEQVGARYLTITGEDPFQKFGMKHNFPTQVSTKKEQFNGTPQSQQTPPVQQTSPQQTQPLQQTSPQQTQPLQQTSPQQTQPLQQAQPAQANTQTPPVQQTTPVQQTPPVQQAPPVQQPRYTAPPVQQTPQLTQQAPYNYQQVPQQTMAQQGFQQNPNMGQQNFQQNPNMGQQNFQSAPNGGQPFPINPPWNTNNQQ